MDRTPPSPTGPAGTTGRRLAAVLAVVALAAGAWIAIHLRGRSAGSEPARRDPPAAEAPGAQARPEKPLAFAIVSALDDRWVQEPCIKSPASGLVSFPAFRDETASRFPTTTLSMGEITLGVGPVAQRIAAYVMSDIYVKGMVDVIAAGPADLGHGSEFVRAALAPAHVKVICANARDASGSTLLAGHQLVDDPSRTPLVVAAVHERYEAEIRERGGDVRLVPAADAVRQALERGEESARRIGRKIGFRVLLFHGTIEETREIVRAVPGFDAAVVGRGGDLPDPAHMTEGATEIFNPGRGLRFGVRLLLPVDGPRDWSLVRIGESARLAGSPIGPAPDDLSVLVRTVLFPTFVRREDTRPRAPGGRYVGATACEPCHTEIVAGHRTSPHAKRPEGVRKEALGMPGCISCHVTGAWNLGGWKGPEDATDLAALSCEACHGPAGDHVDDPSKAGYGRGALERCIHCHGPDRSPYLDIEGSWKLIGHGATR